MGKTRPAAGAKELPRTGMRRKGRNSGKGHAGYAKARKPAAPTWERGQPITDEALRTSKDACWHYVYRHGSSTAGGTPISDPYERAHTAATRWLELHGPVRSEDDMRTYGMVYFTGWKQGAGAMVRGWRDRLANPTGQETWDWVPDEQRDVKLMCPYRYSQHGGASPGGGTFSSQYRKAWSKGVFHAGRYLAELKEAGGAQAAAAPA